MASINVDLGAVCFVPAQIFVRKTGLTEKKKSLTVSSEEKNQARNIFLHYRQIPTDQQQTCQIEESY